jgi:hypothetical protein
MSDAEAEDAQTEYQPGRYTPTEVPTDVPEEEPHFTLGTDIDVATRAAEQSAQDLNRRFVVARDALNEQAAASDRVDPALERKLRILAAEADAAHLRLTYAKLLLDGPPTWRSAATHLDPDDKQLMHGMSSKADTKPKRVLMQLRQFYTLLDRMMSAHGLDTIVRSQRLDFDPKWLEHPCWFVKQKTEVSGTLDFIEFKCPPKPHLACIEINLDYAYGADKITICMPAGKDRFQAWKHTIQWVREIMKLSKLTAMHHVHDLQVPSGFDTNYLYAPMMPCVVWIGEAPTKRDQGPHAQPSQFHRPGPYGMPASSSHQYHGGQGVWWQEQMPPAGPSWQDFWQGQWYQGQWPSGHQ